MPFFLWLFVAKCSRCIPSEHKLEVMTLRVMHCSALSEDCRRAKTRWRTMQTPVCGRKVLWVSINRFGKNSPGAQLFAVFDVFPIRCPPILVRIAGKPCTQTLHSFPLAPFMEQPNNGDFGFGYATLHLCLFATFTFSATFVTRRWRRFA